MFSFLGLRKESKKLPSEKEADGGFVIVGDTVDEQRKKMHSITITQPSTNVIVQHSKSSLPYGAVANPAASQSVTPPPPPPPAAAADPALPDLLGDVPFVLAPHVAAMQAGVPAVPDVLLLRDVNYNLSTFHYDFSLENSVLQNS